MKAEYRSAIRSRKLIRQAFVDLLEEKDFARITVTDIVTRADINRGTFYAHYTDTRAVLEEIENEFIGRLEEAFRDFRYQDFFRNPMPTLSRIAEWIQSDADCYRILLKTSGYGGFLDKLQTIFLDHTMKDSTIPEEVKKRPSFQLQVRFLAAGTGSLYLAWLRGQLDMSLEEISREAGQMICSSAALIYEPAG